MDPDGRFLGASSLLLVFPDNLDFGGGGERDLDPDGLFLRGVGDSDLDPVVRCLLWSEDLTESE